MASAFPETCTWDPVDHGSPGSRGTVAHRARNLTGRCAASTPAYYERIEVFARMYAELVINPTAMRPHGAVGDKELGADLRGGFAFYQEEEHRRFTRAKAGASRGCPKGFRGVAPVGVAFSQMALPQSFVYLRMK